MSTDQRTGTGAEQAENPSSALLDQIRATLEAGVQARACQPAWAAALLDLAAEAAPLAQDDEVYVAQLLHRSLRAEASKDGPPVSRIATMRAPDLRVGRPGDRRTPLPPEVPDELAALADLVAERRSTTMYGADPLPVEHLAGLLRAAFGFKGYELGYQRRDIPRRAVASAGGLQSYDCQVIVNQVEGLEPGRYSYDPLSDDLVTEELGDFRLPLLDVTIESDFITYAQAVIAITGDFPRVAWKYGTRGYRYMALDAGIVTGHLYLAAAALGLSASAIAAFADDRTNALLRLDGKNQFVHLLFPIGTPPGARRR